MPGQSPAERLFTLTCCLMAAPTQGLSKQNLYDAVPGYREAKSDDARDKMFERDKTVLRDLGVRLEVVSFDSFEETDASRYVIGRGSFAWPKELTLSANQLALVELAAKAWNNQLFASSARSGLTRLKSKGLVEADRQLSFISPRLLAKHESFSPLAEAISENKTVVLEYRKADGTKKLRELDPLKLRLIEGEWVLLAAENGELKNYLLRRIVSRVKLTERNFTPASASAISQAEQELVDHAAAQVAQIEVTEDSEAYWHFGGVSTSVSLSYMDESLLAEDLLEFGGEVSVLAPDTLAERVRERLEAVIASHA